MKKLAIIAILLVVIGSVALSQAKPGGIARQTALGGSTAGSGLILNPFIMEDPALMFINPAYQTMYKDYGWSNIGGGHILSDGDTDFDGYGLQNAGIAFGLGGINLGAIFSYDPSAVSMMGSLLSSSGIAQRGLQGIPPVQNVWELVGSMNAGALDLGLGVMYGSSNSTAKTSTPSPSPSSQESEASARVFGARAGAILGMGDNSLDFSVAIRMDKATDRLQATPTTLNPGGEYSVSGTEMEFAVRGKFKMSEKFNFVPYGLLGLLSAEPKEDTPPYSIAPTLRSAKYSVTAYAFGVGGEYMAKSYYIAGGLSFQNAQMKGEVTPTPGTTVTQTMSYTALPVVNLGGEWNVTDWLTGRIGYFRTIGSVTNKVEASTGSIEYSSTYFAPGIPIPGVHSYMFLGGLNPNTWDGIVTLGVGLKFGTFALDATISDEALRRGVGLIGSSDAINTFGYMTASYNFAE